MDSWMRRPVSYSPSRNTGEVMPWSMATMRQVLVSAWIRRLRRICFPVTADIASLLGGGRGSPMRPLAVHEKDKSIRQVVFDRIQHRLVVDVVIGLGHAQQGCAAPHVQRRGQLGGGENGPERGPPPRPPDGKDLPHGIGRGTGP